MQVVSDVTFTKRTSFVASMLLGFVAGAAGAAKCKPKPCRAMPCHANIESSPGVPRRTCHHSGRLMPLETPALCSNSPNRKVMTVQLERIHGSCSRQGRRRSLLRVSPLEPDECTHACSGEPQDHAAKINPDRVSHPLCGVVQRIHTEVLLAEDAEDGDPQEAAGT